MQAPVNPPSCLSAPLQSMTAVARRTDSPLAGQTASGKPDTAFAAANGTGSRTTPPKRRTSSHRSARRRGSTRRAYIELAEAGPDAPHGTSDSQLAEASRNRAFPIHAFTANGDRGTRNTRNRCHDRSHEHPLTGTSTPHIQTLAHEKIRSPKVQCQIRRRLIAAAMQQAPPIRAAEATRTIDPSPLQPRVR
jgi:hypothetical protein